MQYRRLGRTNLDVSVIGLGGLHFTRLKNLMTVQLIMRASDLGINIVEVGKSYAESEEKTGLVMQKYRQKYIIATKTHRRERQDVLKDIDSSLVALKTDYIDIYQIHQVDSLGTLDKVSGPDGALAALKQAKEEGKIGYIGITGHSPAVLAKAVETGEYDTVQVLFNMVEREALKDLIPLAKKMDIGIIGMKPFGGGIFLEKESGISQALMQYSGSVTDALLKYTLSSDLSTVLTGVRSMDELEQNAAVASSFTRILDPELEKMIGILDKMGMKDNDFCHRCGYCMSCPAHIDISYILRLDEYFQKFGGTKMTVGTYRYMVNNVEKCLQCGLCEERCPFKLPVREMLKKAHIRLSAG
jgi:Predicted oxidoreductases of the aldo/keto reductase family